MFSAVCRLTRTEALLVEAPAFIAALIVAETLYKFHSFLLEGSAFVATWLAFSGLLAAARKALAGPSDLS